MYNLLFTNEAEKDLKRLDKILKKRIISKLKDYSKNPFNYSVKLSNDKIGQYRFRIGDFRVIFDIEDVNIIILRIGHRREIYK